jgi:hypothetical protein
VKTDTDELVAQAKGMGAPPEVLAKFVENDTRRKAAIDATKDTESPEFIDVLPCNWNAVQAYLASQWTIETGGRHPVFRGIAAHELKSACELKGIPRREWPLVTYGVAVISGAAREVFQSRTARNAPPARA